MLVLFFHRCFGLFYYSKKLTSHHYITTSSDQIWAFVPHRLWKTARTIIENLQKKWCTRFHFLLCTNVLRMWCSIYWEMCTASTTHRQHMISQICSCLNNMFPHALFIALLKIRLISLNSDIRNRYFSLDQNELKMDDIIEQRKIMATTLFGLFVLLGEYHILVD